jgi:hypothetical protein
MGCIKFQEFVHCLQPNIKRLVFSKNLKIPKQFFETMGQAQPHFQTILCTILMGPLLRKYIFF